MSHIDSPRSANDFTLQMQNIGAISDNSIHSARKAILPFSRTLREPSLLPFLSLSLTLVLSPFLPASAITRPLSVAGRNFVCREILFPVVRRDRNANSSFPPSLPSRSALSGTASVLPVRASETRYARACEISSPRYGFTAASRRNERPFGFFITEFLTYLSPARASRSHSSRLVSHVFSFLTRGMLHRHRRSPCDKPNRDKSIESPASRFQGSFGETIGYFAAAKSSLSEKENPISRSDPFLLFPSNVY